MDTVGRLPDSRNYHSVPYKVFHGGSRTMPHSPVGEDESRKMDFGAEESNSSRGGSVSGNEIMLKSYDEEAPIQETNRESNPDPEPTS